MARTHEAKKDIMHAKVRGKVICVDCRVASLLAMTAEGGAATTDHPKTKVFGYATNSGEYSIQLLRAFVAP